MLKLGKSKRAIALSAATLALAGGATISTATDAQANWGGGGCRTTGWAGTTPGVTLLPCSGGGWGNAIAGDAYFQNPNLLNIDVCEQLLRVNSDGSTSWAHDYGCFGWTTSQGLSYSTGFYAPGTGTYVVQIGYWYDGSYYGNAQSARISIF